MSTEQLQGLMPTRTGMLPYRGTALFQEAACVPQWREFRTLQNASAIWSARSVSFFPVGNPSFLPSSNSGTCASACFTTSFSA